MFLEQACPEPAGPQCPGNRRQDLQLQPLHPPQLLDRRLRRPARGDPSHAPGRGESVQRHHRVPGQYLYLQAGPGPRRQRWHLSGHRSHRRSVQWCKPRPQQGRCHQDGGRAHRRCRRHPCRLRGQERNSERSCVEDLLPLLLRQLQHRREIRHHAGRDQVGRRRVVHQVK